MVSNSRWCGCDGSAGPDIWGGASPVGGAPSMTSVLEPPSGGGGFTASGAPSLTGCVLESPRVVGAVIGCS